MGAAAQVLPEGLAQGLGLRLQAQGLAHLLEEGKGVGLAQALEGELQALRAKSWRASSGALRYFSARAGPKAWAWNSPLRRVESPLRSRR